MQHHSSSLRTSSTSTLAASAERQVALAAAKYLFQRLGGQLGAKFVEMYAGVKQAALEEWSMGLTGFRQHELERGLAECATRKFAPTLGEFAQFCRPALDPQHAWLEACDGLKARDQGKVGEWSHPAVYRAVTGMRYEFQRGTFQQLRVQWERALKKEFEKGWGDEVPPVPTRVEHRPTHTKTPASVHAQLASLKLKIRTQE